MSPTQLSAEFLRKSGWWVEIVEQNVRIKREPKPGQPPEPDLTFKRDLLGFADILALRKGKILLVQTTTLSNVSARVNKIQALVTFEHAKQAGFLIHVHGWADHTKGGGLKVIDMTSMATLWSSIVKRGPRSKKTPRVQGEMQL